MTVEWVQHGPDAGPVDGAAPVAPSRSRGGGPTGDRPPRLRRRWGRWSAIAVVIALAALVALAGGVRLSLDTDPGRALVVRMLDGLPLGPVGRLRIAGLKGDVLSAFSLQRLQIVDARGVWLDASDLSMRWRPGELLARRVHAERIAARRLAILRAPVVKAQPPGRPAKSPVSLRIDRFSLGLETLPELSVRRGLWDVTGRLRLARSGAAAGEIQAQSRLHAGDGLSASFTLGEADKLALRLDAVEASGGALAGALGLPADQRLSVHARADGSAAAGSLTLAAVSGATTPLSARAGWSPAGATVDARLAFTASRLTGYLAQRAGPDARLALTARHRNGDLYDLQGALTAPDATFSFSGPLDWRRRRTAGLDLRLQLADLSKWLPVDRSGPAVTSGVLSGDLDALQYRGALDAHGLVEAGYALADARGPLQLDRTARGLDVRLDLAGTGGSGEGLVPALLGSAPHAKLDLQQLADGRTLVRALDVQGAGLKLQGSGGQGLFGGLSFKGQATVSNLAAAHAGARGVLSADWTAAQPKGAQAWSFGLDGRAQGFASGMADLDHFLGPAPAVAARASYGPAGLQVASASLTGAALQVTAKGGLGPGPAGALAFDLGWSAKGPFDLGPLAVGGAARGTGRIAGDLAAPTVALGADVASLDAGALRIAPVHLDLKLARTGEALGGTVALTGASRYGPALARADYRLQGADIDLTGVDADAGGVTLKGTVALRSGAPSSADLTLAARPGAFLTSGRLDGRVKLAQSPGAGGLGGAAATLALDGQDLSAPGLPVRLHGLHLAADGPFDRLPFRLTIDAAAPEPEPAADAWSFAGDGVLKQAGAVREVDLSGGGKLRGAAVRTLQPAVLRLDPGARDLHALVSLGGGRAEVTARQAGAAVDVRADLAKVSLAVLDADYVGLVSGRVVASGRGASLGGSLDATLAGARSGDAPASLALDGRVKAELAGDRLHLLADASNAQGLKAGLDVTLPAVATAEPFHLAIDRTRPLNGSFSADGELRPLWDLLVGGEQTLSGRVAARGSVSGTLNDPRATGSAALTAGRFEDASTGLALQDLTLSAAFDHDAVAVRQASGSDGHGGTMSGQGTVSLLRGGGSTFALKLAKFRLFDNDLGQASVSGALTVDRNAAGQAKLAGALKVDRAEITANPPNPSGVVAMDVVEINKPRRAGEAPPAPRGPPVPPVALDVAIRAPRGIFVRGKGLNVELSLDAHVGGTAARPDLTGTANLVLGSYDFAGKRFDFDQRGAVHLASDPKDIRLDLSATLEEPTLTAVVRVGGTAAKPEITLSSTPILPQDEVLSQVLFGASAAQLSPAQAAELASALASLSRGGGFDLLGRLRQFAGLDRLALGAGTSGTGVAGGKYINDNVYVELIGGGREGPSASVEWRVRKNFSVISQVGTQGDAQLSIQFRKSY